MKLVNLIALVLLTGISGIPMLAATGEKSLLVTRKDGSTVSMRLAENPRLSFGAPDILTVISDKENYSFELNDVASYSFSDEGAGAEIVSPDAAARPVVRNGHVVFGGLPPEVPVFVWTLDGKILLSCLTDQAGGATIDLGLLPAGTFIIGNKNSFIKILK